MANNGSRTTGACAAQNDFEHVRGSADVQPLLARWFGV